jgi:4-amino-4-deoxy-L-arabinose transferase-like glycosyltransferase
LAGFKVGFFVLLLYVFSPTILAHGRLVTTDVPAALAITLAIYFYLKFLESPNSLTNILKAGLFLGVALLTKFSSFILLPYFIFLVILRKIIMPLIGCRERISFFIIIKVLGIFLGAFLLVGLVYSYNMSSYPRDRQIQDTLSIMSYSQASLKDGQIVILGITNSLVRPYVHYTSGLLRTLARANKSTPEFFLGHLNLSINWWYYFPIIYFSKEPIALHLLVLLSFFGGIIFIKKKELFFSLEKTESFLEQHFQIMAIIFFVILYFSLSMMSSINIGVRHLMPIFPFLYILVALSINKWLNYDDFLKQRFKKIIIVLCFGWYIISGLSAYPNYLTYYNEFVGGQKSGYKIALNSNYDWGQDLKRLSTWIEERKIDKIYLDFFGRSDPGYYLGEKYRPWYGSTFWSLRGKQVSKPEEFPRGNYLAVSITYLLTGNWRNPGTDQKDYDWLSNKQFVGRVGQTIFVYYIK